MSFAGFRGSVGIALSLSLYARVMQITEDNQLYNSVRNDVDKLFCFVGGIALATLLCIGLASKPVLERLELATPEKTRHKVVKNYKQQLVRRALQNYVRLLSQKRFKGIDHSIVKDYVPALRNITLEQLMEALKWHKNNTPDHLYQIPALEHV